jgi:hypothetical protein
MTLCIILIGILREKTPDADYSQLKNFPQGKTIFKFKYPGPDHQGIISGEIFSMAGRNRD